jgi:TolB-like protein/Tfp pilus assembly protein PilF
MGEPSVDKPLSQIPSEDQLDSWKEIALYLHRDVTTVQRWEKQEGMPVHRHLHHKRGSVYALTSELDAWRQSRKLRADEEDEEQDTAPDAATAAPAAEPAAVDDRQTTAPRRRPWPVAGFAALALVAVTALAYFGSRIGAGSATRPGIHSLAVLPLQNLSGDPTQNYIADGMTEELIGRLSRIHGLRVISRTSSMHFKNTQLSVPEIARMLGVDAIVEGSLVQEGHEVRVHAQLIRAATDEHIWAGEYQREYQSLLDVEGEVARNIVEQIELNLTPEEQARLTSGAPVDPQAYEYYLKGRYYFSQRTEDALHKSIASFEQAVGSDPGYAPAYSGVAAAYAMLGFRGGLPSKEALAAAKKAALKAIELDNSLAEPHASLAFIEETYDWDWRAAESEYKKALELNPGDAEAHNWYAGYLTYTGRFDEAIAEAMRARELDPLSLPVNNALAGRFLAGGRDDEALRQVQKTLELDSHFAPAHQTLGWVYLHGRKPNEAIQEFQNALQLSGAADTDMELDLGFAYAVTGRQDEARKILNKLERMHAQGIVPAASVAVLSGALGESNQAFAWLETAYSERDPQLTYLKAGRRFEPLRGDPRFSQFVRRVGLSD